MQQTQTDPARRQAGNDKSSRACAKLNLSLHVVGQREDGYHLLDSLVTFVEEADEIRLTTPLSAEDQLEISGPFAKSLQGGSNSLHDALALLRSIAAEHACTVPPLAMHLHKKLPVASGIGGGSADAAALLRLLLPDLPDTIQKQVILNAVQLGADVPMCLFQKTAVARGIGDLLQPLANLPSMPIVLINPGIAVSTPAIFRLLEQRNNAPMPEIDRKSVV